MLWLVTALALACVFGAPLANAQNFGTVNLGSTSSQAITVKIATGGTVSKISVLTQGNDSLDFSNNGVGTCLTGAYSANQTCVVNVLFSPVEPGLRQGAVVLYNSSGTALGTAYLYGTAVGSLLRYNPGTASTYTAH